MLTEAESHCCGGKVRVTVMQDHYHLAVRSLRMNNAREIVMLSIQGLKCIYDTTGRGWAMEITLEGEKATKRFDLDGPEDAEMLIEAFEDSSASHFDPVTGEISFAYEYAEHAADEDEDSEDETAEADESDEVGDDAKRHDTKKEVA